MRKFKTLRNLMVMAVFSLVLTACAAVQDTEEQPGEQVGQNDVVEQPAVQVQGGEAVWISNAAPPTLDPHVAVDIISRNAMRQIYETLTALDENNNVVPHLALSYEMLDDLTWEFVLRQGIVFHDGAPFNAYAVATNFRRLLDPANAYPGAVMMEAVARVEIIDEYVVHFITHAPFVPLPAQLSQYNSLIISPLAIQVQDEGGYLVAERPMGTGPFAFYSHTPGNYIRFVRFDDYWMEPAILDSLVFRIIPDPSTRLMMLESGEAHGMIAMLSDVVVFEDVPQVNVESVLSTRTEFLIINTSRPPFDNMRLRQALAMAVNREDILYGIADGQGVLAQGPIAPNVTHSPTDVQSLPFDPQRSREILQELGYYGNLETELWIYEGNSVMARTAELMQSNWADVGITATINVMERGAYLSATAAGELPLALLGWTGGTGDPDIQVFPLFYSGNFGGLGNRSFFYHPRADELLALGRSVADFNERAEIYRELVEILLYYVPNIFLYHPQTPIATNGITGLRTDFTFTPFFHRVALTN